ncbi:hypothetical protein GCM10022276_00500 [Sphingomonas limnosediminicola]|uniref:Uncharacterized protein n=1 Tax=Sphingomonas limnosediminicola TaxID=940133 RepID=A0ABP7KR79_9SPHN
MASFINQAFGLTMDLGNERTGGIHVTQAAVARRRRHRLRHAVRRKDDRAVIRHFIKLLDEYRTHLAQPFDHEAIVDDFMAHIDGRTETLERKLDDLDGAIDAGAKAARRRNQQAKGRE